MTVFKGVNKHEELSLALTLALLSIQILAAFVTNGRVRNPGYDAARARRPRTQITLSPARTPTTTSRFFSSAERT